MSEWQPIETAPKDGTRILLFIPSTVEWQTQSIGRWESDKYARRPKPYWSAEIEGLMGGFWMRGSQPTYWQPLPEPPK